MQIVEKKGLLLHCTVGEIIWDHASEGYTVMHKHKGSQNKVTCAFRDFQLLNCATLVSFYQSFLYGINLDSVRVEER